MVAYAYTGTLADIGLGVLTAHAPVMRVRPEVEAFAALSSALVSAVPVAVPLDPVTGAFSMQLIPSGDLTPAAGGRPGVDYIIEVGRFEQSIDGTYFAGSDFWKFTAVVGGGKVTDMSGGSLLSVFLGPPWPSLPSPRGLYIDMAPPNPWGIKE